MEAKRYNKEYDMRIGEMLEEKYSGIMMEVVHVASNHMLVKCTVTGCQWMIRQEHYKNFRKEA